MTLITTLIGESFSIIAGEGCTVTDDKKVDEKLRKVYINSDSCVAFAGENWITEEFTKKNIYVASLIEHFLSDNKTFLNCGELSCKLTDKLKEHNKQLKTELFISTRMNGKIENAYANTFNDSVQKIAFEKDVIKLQFSYHPKKEYKLLEDHFIKKWNEYFSLKQDNKLRFHILIHNIDEICKFLDSFYSEVWKFSCIDSFAIGKSKDIAVVEIDNIRFYKKENLTTIEKL